MTTQLTSFIDTKTEPFFERHAWKVLLGVSLMIGFFGVGDMLGGASDLQAGETVFMHSITGISWNELQAASPRVANLIDLKFRMDGAALTTIALLSMAIGLTGFRRGERWAWYALWALPFWTLSTVVFIVLAEKQPGSGTPVPIISGSILTAICLSMLGLSYRKFFRI
jgi:hypothetical protein